MSLRSVRLGGTASHIHIGGVGLGLMMMTLTSKPTPDDEAFEAIKTAIDQVPKESKLFINSGEFYGHYTRTANLDLVARFFEKYPKLADKCSLSVKNLHRSVDNVLKTLNGKKKLDLFQCAGVDRRISIEDTISTLRHTVQEGKFDHIGVSEVSVKTLRRANKVHPIAAVEIEISPWSYEDEAKRVLEAAKELEIPVIAYSPLGKGLIAGSINMDDLPADDIRRHFARFQREAIAKNQYLVDKFAALAERKGVTSAQLALIWVISRGLQVVPIPGSSKAARVVENMMAGQLELTPGELASVDDFVKESQANLKGARGITDDGKLEGFWG